MRLFLPDKYRWFDFGGTMRLVAGDAELQAGYLRFKPSRPSKSWPTCGRATHTPNSAAAANLKSQEANVQQFVETLTPQDAATWSAIRVAGQHRRPPAGPARGRAARAVVATRPTAGNRLQLGNLYQTQKGGRARNVVSEFEANWSDAGGVPYAGEPGRDQPQAFDAEWLRGNQLASDSTRKQAISELSKKMADVSRT